MPRLNSVLDDVACVIGYTPTRIMAAWWAGRTLYVPARVRPGHPLDVLLGRMAYMRLVRAFPEQYLSVPPLAEDMREIRDRQIADALARGEPDAAVAALHGITERRVRQIKLALTENGLLDFELAASHAGFDPAASHERTIYGVPLGRRRPAGAPGG